MTRELAYVLALFLGSLLIAMWQGTELEASNPNGIWLYTPPADGSGQPSNAYAVGFNLGFGFVAFFYASVALALSVLAKLKYLKNYRFSLVLLVSFVISVGAMVIANAWLL